MRTRLVLVLLLSVSVPAFCQNAESASAAVGTSAVKQQPEVATPLHIGGPITPPRVIHSIDPQYSEDARENKISGSVQVYLWVDEDGNPSHLRVVRGVGHGLDEKAVEAIRQYKFSPAMRDGKPVKVDLYIEVSFRIGLQVRRPRN